MPLWGPEKESKSVWGGGHWGLGQTSQDFACLLKTGEEAEGVSQASERVHLVTGERMLLGASLAPSVCPAPDYRHFSYLL